MSFRDGGTVSVLRPLGCIYYIWTAFRRKGQGRTMKAAVTLKENYEFRRLYQKGASAVSPAMVLYCRKNRLGRNRLGLVSSTKLGHAVVRNRVRRRLREIFRLNQSGLAQGYDMILVARTRAVGAEYRELERAFLSVCGKLGLREKKP